MAGEGQLDRKPVLAYNCSRFQPPTKSDDELCDSEASLRVALATTGTPVYKKYSEERLLEAIKAVVNDGAKNAEASAKYGIPFTTLTRKIRQCRANGGLQNFRLMRRVNASARRQVPHNLIDKK